MTSRQMGRGSVEGGKGGGGAAARYVCSRINSINSSHTSAKKWINKAEADKKPIRSEEGRWEGKEKAAENGATRLRAEPPKMQAMLGQTRFPIPPRTAPIPHGHSLAQRTKSTFHFDEWWPMSRRGWCPSAAAPAAPSAPSAPTACVLCPVHSAAQHATATRTAKPEQGKSASKRNGMGKEQGRTV